jgi:hypothetical protein
MNIVHIIVWYESQAFDIPNVGWLEQFLFSMEGGERWRTRLAQVTRDRDSAEPYGRMLLNMTIISGGPRSFQKPGQTCLKRYFFKQNHYAKSENTKHRTSASLGDCPGCRDGRSAHGANDVSSDLFTHGSKSELIC